MRHNPLVCLGLIGIFNTRKDANDLIAEVRKIADRWLADLERHLEGREWVACAEFTVADILMSCVLRYIRKGDLMEPYPQVRDYYSRAQSRPAWQRTLNLYAQRVGASIEDIR